jgi:hypothetical protein
MKQIVTITMDSDDNRHVSHEVEIKRVTHDKDEAMRLMDAAMTLGATLVSIKDAS